ncbi:hypothetical protein LEP1GSC016_3066 [Leptospira borgpetersenii serovar Hardjo-bovis str. Sponselee]|uniref:Uncharacterized protein n=7 Tax=Leptospira borgpetersenii TaxID=174 RepID=M3FJ17_LEPBO|nr:hypothetical protein LBBP_02617 [Leptospira borgpetersenii serovar Ballum]EKP13608.1 hypothetical protein LEP1GSC128_2679 [Leptospira borgpetersenii str. 200801926]EKQ90345.1 hypothetical protein LEP1GSC101_1957 [Leptospira borgpetersenii str. UI 09149]EKR01308.1 hypothetical protein LEP1GSC121_2803 [Leptospira borgpetersenii serovar Castellonis str. 200801910]EMG01823.1 hypothetical protein LEP1GSC123_0469 [Leptospira borgpetersenii str. 200701203]EMJ83671.1 hypothetical protein LEP1GSC016
MEPIISSSKYSVKEKRKKKIRFTVVFGFQREIMFYYDRNLQ